MIKHTCGISLLSHAYISTVISICSSKEIFYLAFNGATDAEIAFNKTEQPFVILHKTENSIKLPQLDIEYLLKRSYS